MCGIAGLIGGSPHSRAERVQAALACLRHRGPDGAGLLTLADNGDARLEVNGMVRSLEPAALPAAGNLVMGNQRLSIIDLSASAGQPMAAHDDRYVLSFNGEIYNYLELRAALERTGEVFQTRSDTEVLLRGFARWGLDVLQRVEGMFALALVDRAASTLVLARDCFGMKPLYYAATAHEFAFASEIGALLKLTGTRATADPAGLREFLATGVTDHRADSMFAGIRQLPAAHYLHLSISNPGASEPIRYWAPDLSHQDDRSQTELARAFRDLFFESIALHLRSDVPFGTLLSGGLDSSAIVGAMREVGGASLELRTFSYVPEAGEAFSEEPWIDQVNAAFDARSCKVTLRLDEWETGLSTLVRRQAEPFGSIAIAAQHALFRACAQQGVRVVLEGQGADELFGGYAYARGFRLAGQIRHSHVADAWHHVRTFQRINGTRAARALALHAARLLTPEPVVTALRKIRKPAAGLVNTAWFAERLPDTAPTRPPASLRDRLLADVQASTLPGLLRYADRNAMSFSVENRLPFLTRKLAQFAFTLPDAFLVDDRGMGKSLLRAALRGIIPESVIERREKVAFAVPLTNWLARSETVHAALQRAAALPFIDQRELSRLLAARHARALTAPQIFALWRVFGVVQWLEAFDVQVG